MRVIIILGCRNIPVCNKRLERALQTRTEYFLVSGGNGEAEYMRKFLMERRVPIEKILTENKSKSTWENVLFSNQILMNKFKEKPKVTICTSTAHSTRAMIMARMTMTHISSLNIIDTNETVSVKHIHKERGIINSLLQQVFNNNF